MSLKMTKAHVIYLNHFKFCVFFTTHVKDSNILNPIGSGISFILFDTKG